MKGFKSNIEKDTLGNNDFRHVFYTGKYSQLVLMSLKPGEEIGEEVHKTVDQFFRFEKGTGTVTIDGVARASSTTRWRISVHDDSAKLTVTL